MILFPSQTNATLYDWDEEEWVDLSSNPAGTLDFAVGRGFGCGFVQNGSDPYVIVAGGNSGESFH